jgi:putative tryptophan/tyrosine transport system substrate-binding protein
MDRVQRRDFLIAAGALLATSLAADVQQAARITRIGFLTASRLSSITLRTEAFRQGLRNLGYVEGQNIVIEWRSADETLNRLPALAAELVDLKVAVIIAGDNASSAAAKEVTKTVPIVMATSSDPIGIGLVANLAHPGGNVTGLTSLSIELFGKQVGLLKELIPTLSRVAVLSSPANPANTRALREIETSTRRLGLQLQPVEIREAKQLDDAFSAMIKERADALLVLPDAVLLTQRTQIADLATRNRLPTIFTRREGVEAGGLMCYGSSLSDQFRYAATFVDKILKGAKPGDLPVEQPTKFELVINLKAAKDLGLNIPQSMLARAHEVI